MVHVTAQEGYANVGAVYEKGRPEYPSDAVSFLLQRLGVGGAKGDARVVDVAAGTGKFTRALLAAGLTPVAVEPVAHMRETFTQQTPGVDVVDGTAESMPFGDSAIDAVFAAQAFHWFDAGAALREFHRVLRPVGGLGLIWNGADRSVSWVDAIWRRLDALRDDTPSAWTYEWRNVFVDGNGFTPLRDAAFRHDHATDRDGLIARVTSVSFVARGPEQARLQLVDHVRRVCDAEGLPERFVLPYTCYVYWCLRR